MDWMCFTRQYNELGLADNDLFQRVHLLSFVNLRSVEFPVSDHRPSAMHVLLPETEKGGIEEEHNNHGIHTS